MNRARPGILQTSERALRNPPAPGPPRGFDLISYGNRETVRIRSLRNPQQGIPSLERQEAQVSAAKTKKNGPAGESGDQRPKRRKDKLIRLDDLIPKQDVKGGYQLLFGATDTTQTTNPTKEN